MEKNVHEFTIKIEGEEWEKALDKAFKKKNKNAKIDGFRPGHAPKEVFLKHYGKEVLYLDASDEVLESAYEKVLEKEKVIPIVQPKVDIKSLDEKGIEFVFTITERPEVKIAKYKDLGVKMEDAKVTDKEVEHEIHHLLDHYAEFVTKDGEVANGDVAVIDYEGFKDDIAFDGGKGENYSLEIGSNTFIPGFEDQVIGMKTGEEKDIKVTFPEDYHAKDLAGCPVVFKVKVNEIKTKQERELDSEFFEDLGMEGVDSKEKLEEEIRKNLEAKKEEFAENKYVDDMLKAISEHTEVNIPEELVDEETKRLVARYEEQLKMQGISLDLYYQITNTKEEDLFGKFHEDAHKNVLYRFILEEISKLENIEVTEEDGEKRALELAEKYQMKKEDLIKEFGGMDVIMYDLEIRKVFDKLKEYNK